MKGPLRVRHSVDQWQTDLGKQPFDLAVAIGLKLPADLIGQIRSNTVFQSDSIGLRPGHGLPDPPGLANLRPDLLTQIKEQAIRHAFAFVAHPIDNFARPPGTRSESSL